MRPDRPDPAAMLSRASEHAAGLAAILDSFPDGSMLVFDSELRYLMAGGRGLAPAGLSAGQLEGRTIWEALPEATAAEVEPYYRAALRGEHSRFDVAYGDRIYEVHISPIDLPGSRVTMGLAFTTDVTEERLREAALADSELRFRIAFDNAPISMAVIALDGRFLLVNSAMAEMTGYPAEQLLTMSECDVTMSDAPGTDRSLTEERYRKADGQIGWVLAARSLVRDHGGEALHVLAHLQDITERRLHLLELEQLASSDSMTGVLNRRRFTEELERYERLVSRYGEEGALLVLDLDGLKAVNDTRGHLAGDAYISEAAAAICGRVRATDIVARLGGDEFGVLLPHVDAVHAFEVAKALAQDIAACPTHGTVSVGVAMINGSDAVRALEDADAAMYRAKRAGGNRVAAARDQQPD